METATKVIGGVWGDEGSSRLQHAWNADPDITRSLAVGQAGWIHSGGCTWVQVARPRPSPLPLPPPSPPRPRRWSSRPPSPPRNQSASPDLLPWMTCSGRTGITTIAARLNAGPAACPPPAQAGAWTPNAVYQLLANPKYTGHMVWNRTSKRSGRKRPLPPDQWIWSPEPVHPAVISRELYEQAQQVTLHRASIAGDPAAPAHPLAQRSYELRSRIRHRSCKRRMQGSTRASGVYYCCPHSVTNPRHAAASPDHPRSVIVREDTLVPLVCQFISHRVLGPERGNLLAAQLPADAAEQAAQADKQRAALHKEIRRLDVAQASQIQELDTLPTDPADRAAAARRSHPRPLRRTGHPARPGRSQTGRP